MSKPIITVVIPAYNAQDTLAETLDSVISQNRQPDEIILVDDGSTDSTIEIAKAYENTGAPLKIISQMNQGTAGAYNTGIETISDGWIVMLSADDLILPDHLLVLEQTIKAKPHVHLISSNGYYLDDGKKTLANFIDVSPYEGNSCTLEDLIKSCFFAVGAAFTKEAYDAVGGFVLGFYAEDYLFFLEVLASGYEHAYTDQATSVHRRTKQQKSNRVLEMREEEILDFKIIQEKYCINDEARTKIDAKIKILKRNNVARRILYRFLPPDKVEALIRRAMYRFL